jgi:hypothetical protein
MSTFDSESFELELNGRAWDTYGSSFVQIPSVVLQGWFWRSGSLITDPRALIRFRPTCLHHERTTLSQVNPEHCRLVSLKIGATSLEGNSAKGSSMDFALLQKEPFLLRVCVG